MNYVDPLGLEGIGYWTFPPGPMRDALERWGWRTCTAAEINQCRTSCESRGLKYSSCRYRYGVRNTVRGGEVVPEIFQKPGGISCSCTDPDDLTAKICAVALVVTYWIVSEGSRLFPPRNLVPVP